MHKVFFLNDTFSPGLLMTLNATGNFVSAKNDSYSSNSRATANYFSAPLLFLFFLYNISKWIFLNKSLNFKLWQDTVYIFTYNIHHHVLLMTCSPIRQPLKSSFSLTTVLQCLIKFTLHRWTDIYINTVTLSQNAKFQLLPALMLSSHYLLKSHFRTALTA